MRLCAAYDVQDDLWWNADPQFFIICNDVFYWGGADFEDVADEADLALLEKSLIDSKLYGTALYCARRRKMRPQKQYYELLDAAYAGMFIATGPERDEE